MSVRYHWYNEKYIIIITGKIMVARGLIIKRSGAEIKKDTAGTVTDSSPQEFIKRKTASDQRKNAGQGLSAFSLRL